MVSFLISLIWLYCIAGPLIHQSVFTFPAVAAALSPIIGFFFLTSLVISIVSVLQTCFVSPLMLRFDLPCLQAWGVFMSLLSGNVLAIIGFLLLRFLYSALAGIVMMLVGCVTCCIGLLPVISQTVMSPYYVFDRSMSLYMLQDLGPEYTFIAQ